MKGEKNDIRLEKKIAFVRKMKRENPRAFAFLSRSATDLLQKIAEDEEREKTDDDEGQEPEAR